LGNLQGAHCEYQKALDGHKSDSYAHKAVDGPRKFMAWTARLGCLGCLGSLVCNLTPRLRLP